MKVVIRLVALLNFAYFGIEFVVALKIGSVSLFADSVDFLEDAAVNFLILVALRWSTRNRARVGMVLAGLLLVPGLATLWMVGKKFYAPIAPHALPLSVAGIGALLINLTCAIMLARYRYHKGSMTKAAFLSSRNDVFANIAIIGAGITTAIYRSVWPDLLVGLAIAIMNIDAAKEVWQAARAEHRSPADS